MIESRKVRDRDRLRAKDVKIKREREAEGDTYQGVEQFVTSSYKKQQEEMERVSREEAEKDEQNRTGMKGFYSSMLKQQEKQQHNEPEPEPESYKPRDGANVDLRRTPTYQTPHRAATSASPVRRQDQSREVERQIEQQQRKRQQEAEQSRDKAIDRMKSRRTDLSAIEAARERYRARKLDHGS